MKTLFRPTQPAVQQQPPLPLIPPGFTAADRNMPTPTISPLQRVPTVATGISPIQLTQPIAPLQRVSSAGDSTVTSHSVAAQRKKVTTANTPSSTSQLAPAPVVAAAPLQRVPLGPMCSSPLVIPVDTTQVITLPQKQRSQHQYFTLSRPNAIC